MSLQKLAEQALNGRYEDVNTILSNDIQGKNLYGKQGIFQKESENFYIMTPEQQCMFLLFVDVSGVLQ